jgi:hypothetical protein
MVPEMTAAMTGVIGKKINVINGFGAPPTWQFYSAASSIRWYRLKLSIDFTILFE